MTDFIFKIRPIWQNGASRQIERFGTPCWNLQSAAPAVAGKRLWLGKDFIATLSSEIYMSIDYTDSWHYDLTVQLVLVSKLAKHLLNADLY